MKTKIAVISDIHANADALTTVHEELKNNSVDITDNLDNNCLVRFDLDSKLAKKRLLV